MTDSFSMYSGDSKRLNFTITDATTGDVYDITGVTARWQASRAKPTGFSSTPILTKAEGSGLEIVDAIGGAIAVDLYPADTLNLSGVFRQELEIVDADGDVATVHVSTFTIDKALIRPPV